MTSDDLEFYPGSRQRRQADPKQPDDVADVELGKPYTHGIPGDPEMPCYTIGALALALNRDSKTVRRWEAKGYIPYAQYNNFVHKAGCPATMYTDAECTCPQQDIRAYRRLYTREQILGMAKIADEEGILYNTAKHITNTRFTERVLMQWQEKGWY